MIGLRIVSCIRNMRGGAAFVSLPVRLIGEEP
jgi:hypothetical protein